MNEEEKNINKDIETNNEEEKNEVIEVANEENHNENQKIEAKQDKEMINPVEKIAIDDPQQTLDDYNKLVDNFNIVWKQTKRINTVMIVVVIVLAVVSVILTGLVGDYMIYILVGIIVLYFLATFFYSKTTQKKINSVGTEVLNHYFLYSDSYAYQNDVFEDVKFDYNLKIDSSYFLSLDIFKDVDKVAGRDLVLGKIFNHDFVAGDGSINTLETNEAGKKVKCIVFYGKAFFLEHSYINHGKLIVYLKGKGNDEPTNVDGLKQVSNNLSDKFIMYSNNDNEKIITNEVADALERFEINDNLYDLFVVFDEQRTTFLFSYSDPMMVVSVYEPLKEEIFNQYPTDVNKMVEVIKALEKK